jgi:hypothetical protein
MMKTIKLTLLAAAGIALLAAAPASAQTQPRHAAHVSAKGARVQPYPAGGVYLLENRGAAYGGGAAANTNAAESFQSNFDVDY